MKIAIVLLLQIQQYKKKKWLLSWMMMMGDGDPVNELTLPYLTAFELYKLKCQINIHPRVHMKINIPLKLKYSKSIYGSSLFI